MSDISNLIDSLPLREYEKAFFGGFIYLVVPIILAFCLFSSHWNAVKLNRLVIIEMLFALIWVGVGPVLIWYYERHLLINFWLACRSRLARGQEFENIRHRIFSHPLSSPIITAFCILWVLVILLGFFNASKYMEKIGISGPADIFWWLLLVGISVVGWYGAIGFCLLYKTVSIMIVLLRAPFSESSYFSDNLHGMSLAANLVYPTLASFASGWLFAPGLVGVVAATQFNTYEVIYFLITGYSAAIITGSIILGYLIHTKIVILKNLKVKLLHSKVEAAARKLPPKFSTVAWIEEQFYRNLLRDALSISVWPFSIYGIAKFFAATLIFPCVAAVSAEALFHSLTDKGQEPLPHACDATIVKKTSTVKYNVKIESRI